MHKALPPAPFENTVCFLLTGSLLQVDPGRTYCSYYCLPDPVCVLIFFLHQHKEMQPHFIFLHCNFLKIKQVSLKCLFPLESVLLSKQKEPSYGKIIILENKQKPLMTWHDMQRTDSLNSNCHPDTGTMSPPLASLWPQAGEAVGVWILASSTGGPGVTGGWQF